MPVDASHAKNLHACKMRLSDRLVQAYRGNSFRRGWTPRSEPLRGLRRSRVNSPTLGRLRRLADSQAELSAASLGLWPGLGSCGMSAAD